MVVEEIGKKGIKKKVKEKGKEKEKKIDGRGRGATNARFSQLDR